MSIGPRSKFWTILSARIAHALLRVNALHALLMPSEQVFCTDVCDVGRKTLFDGFFSFVVENEI